MNGMRGVTDYDKALGWFHRAADLGMPEAQNNMGVCYDNGWGVKTNAAEAVRWYRKAAAQDHAGSMRALGEHYKAGSGVAKGERAAVDWFKKAVALEDAAAMRLLGPYYLSGKFVPEDKAKGEAQKKAADSIAKRLANSGGTPRFASAQEWDAVYRGAPYLTASEFLKKAKAVRLRIIGSPRLLDLATDTQLRALVEKQLELKGLRDDPAAPVELLITLDLNKAVATRRSTKYGKSSRNNQVHDTFAWGRGPTDMREALFYSDLEMFYALVSSIRIRQNDVVYELGPELYRGDVTLMSREKVHTSFPDEAGEMLPKLVEEHVGDFVKELRFRR